MGHTATTAYTYREADTLTLSHIFTYDSINVVIVVVAEIKKEP